jgi:hypothetical protein
MKNLARSFSADPSRPHGRGFLPVLILSGGEHMASGGYRPNAGRPRLATTQAKSGGTSRGRTTQPRQRSANEPSTSPLDYMLSVMRDETADSARRDRMAIASAPFIPQQPSDRPLTRKEQAELNAKTAHRDTEWESLVERFERLP